MGIVSVIAIAVAAASAPGPAKPVYLSCTFPKNGAVLKVNADEANSSVTTVLISSGHTETYRAAFTATDVRFEDRLISYALSRTDLTIRRMIKMIASEDIGTCAIEGPPKRAF